MRGGRGGRDKEGREGFPLGSGWERGRPSLHLYSRDESDNLMKYVLVVQNL